MYVNPHQKLAQLQGIEVDEKEAQEYFDEFYEDMFTELGSFGELEEMYIIGNIAEHLVGHLYAKFYREEDAQKALEKLNGLVYDGRRIEAEFSPVTNFMHARCRLHSRGECMRGGYCGFIHDLRPSPNLLQELRRRQHKQLSLLESPYSSCDSLLNSPHGSRLSSPCNSSQPPPSHHTPQSSPLHHIPQSSPLHHRSQSSFPDHSQPQSAEARNYIPKAPRSENTDMLQKRQRLL